MLKPEYLDRLPDRLVELYVQVEADILMDMAKRISAYDMFIPAALHQYRKVAELGELHERIMERLSAITGIAEQELNRLLSEAGQEAIRSDDKVYQRAGYTPTPFDASPQLREILRDGIEATSGLFQNLTSTTANTASKQFEDALDRAWMKVSSGAFDYNTAIKMAVKELSAEGIRTVRYPSGHTDHLDVAVRRAVITGASQTAARLQLKRLDEMEWDLVETTAHDGARPTHEVWQGKRFSRGGEYREKYPDFKESTGYGTGPGLCGWNCRHHFYPVVEGSEPTYSKEQLDAMKEKRYEYNGHKMTEYEATQQQRYIERQIRRWKREYLSMKAAGLDMKESAAKLSKWRKVQNDFLNQTGLKRQYAREAVEGFGRSEGEKATWKAKTYRKVVQGRANPIGDPDSTVDIARKDGTIMTRRFYGAEGKATVDIDTSDHGNPKEHPFGAHAHEWYVDEDGKLKRGEARELNDVERKDNKDILEGGDDRE